MRKNQRTTAQCQAVGDMPDSFVGTSAALSTASKATGGVMSSDGPGALKFLHTTLSWVEQLERTPDPALDSESVAELKVILIARIAKLESVLLDKNELPT
jgi:hypothetical protein